METAILGTSFIATHFLNNIVSALVINAFYKMNYSSNKYAHSSNEYTSPTKYSIIILFTNRVTTVHTTSHIVMTFFFPSIKALFDYSNNGTSRVKTL